MTRFDGWARRGCWRLYRAAWLAPLACFWAAPLHAQPTLQQGCKDLSVEDSARLETRLLASLLRPEAAGVNVSVACELGIATVSASVGPPETRRSVALSGPSGLEAILVLAGRAVALLLAPPDTGAPAVVSLPADAARPDPASDDAHGAAAAPAPVRATEPAEPTHDTTPAAAVPAQRADAIRARHDSRVRAEVVMQSWGSDAAAGAALGLEQALGKWTYAFLAGGARPFQQPSLSAVNEWTAAAEFGWQAADPLGIRLSTRLGFSLLTVNPDSDVITSSGAAKSAGFLELDCSRPIWFGRFGLAPGVGLRAFSAKRAVTIEGQPELQLSTPSVHAFLSLLFRISQ